MQKKAEEIIFGDGHGDQNGHQRLLFQPHAEEGNPRAHHLRMDTNASFFSLTRKKEIPVPITKNNFFGFLLYACLSEWQRPRDQKNDVFLKRR